MQRAMFPSDTGVRCVAPKIPNLHPVILTTIIAGFVHWVIREPRYIRHSMPVGGLLVPSLALITAGCSAGNARVIQAQNIIATTSLWKTAILNHSGIHHIAVCAECMCLKTTKWFEIVIIYNNTNNFAGLTPVHRTSWYRSWHFSRT